MTREAFPGHFLFYMSQKKSNIGIFYYVDYISVKIIDATSSIMK